MATIDTVCLNKGNMDGRESCRPVSCCKLLVLNILITTNEIDFSRLDGVSPLYSPYRQ